MGPFLQLATEAIRPSDGCGQFIDALFGGRGPHILIPRKQLDERNAFRFEFVFDGLCVTRVVEPGDAAEMITRYAERNEVDLINLPTHGLGTFRWLLLGSVTAKVLHDSICPVWTSVHSETLPPGTAREIRTILCGVDLYSEPVRVIRPASDMARNCGAVVRLVHAIAAPEGKPGSNIDAGLKRFLFDTASEQIIKCQDEASTDWEVCIQSGSVASVLRDAAVHFEADLAVIGRGHLQSRFGRFRSNVGAIIRRIAVPGSESLKQGSNVYTSVITPWGK